MDANMRCGIKNAAVHEMQRDLSERTCWVAVSDRHHFVESSRRHGMSHPCSRNVIYLFRGLSGFFHQTVNVAAMCLKADLQLPLSLKPQAYFSLCQTLADNSRYSNTPIRGTHVETICRPIGTLSAEYCTQFPVPKKFIPIKGSLAQEGRFLVGHWYSCQNIAKYALHRGCSAEPKPCKETSHKE